MNVSRMAGLGGVSSAAMNKPHSAKDPDGRRIQNDTELQQRAAQTDRSQNRVPRGIDSVVLTPTRLSDHSESICHSVCFSVAYQLGPHQFFI